MCRMPGKSILLVEDEPLVRDLLAHNLRAEGYAVEAVPSFAEAWQRVTNRLYALVIADWRLPDGDGTQIADAAVERGMKTFVMSGYLLQMSAERAERYDAMMKPIRPAEMIAAVERRI